MRPNKRQVYLFAKKFIYFFVLVFLLDFSIGKLLQHFYFTTSSGSQARLNYSIERTHADLLIMGSSRAAHHYNPKIFEDSFKLSAYNSGTVGQDIIFNYAVLKCILKRYTPKVVVLDIIPGEFSIKQKPYDKLSSLLPFYKNHPEIHDIIELRGKSEHLKLLSQIYPYNSLILNIIGGNLESMKKKKGDIQGYVPLYNIYKGKMDVSQNKPYKLDSLKLHYYELFIHECNKRKINLFIVCSPTYQQYLNTDYSILAAKKMASQNNIKFYDCINDTPFINHATWFYDDFHLNDTGATVFSNNIAHTLKEDYKFISPTNVLAKKDHF
jgi:lysophospholipase L1-like esterase